MQWRLAEALRGGELSVKDLSRNIIEHLVYAIFPGGWTILHFLADNADELINLLEYCHKNGKIEIHLPFLPDFSGATALHMVIEKKSYKAVDTILRCLALYPSDHHSKAIKNAYDKVVKL